MAASPGVAAVRPEGATGPVFIGNDIYRRSSFAARHPLSVPRVPATIDLCRALGWLPDRVYRTSVAASPAEIVRFHDPTYLDALRRGERGEPLDDVERERFNLGRLENPIHDTMYRRPAISAGALLSAAELLVACDRAIVYSPAGGTHHGRPARASGFCYFNDLALAILRLLDRGVERVLYVDYDAHHGDGVQDAFHDDDRVLTISIHEKGRWPFTGAADDLAGGAACNLPVPRGFVDDELAFLVDRVVIPLGERFQPQIVVIQCGADALADDPLSRLELSNGALWRAVSRTVTLASRVLVTGGGGYNPWSVARCWSGLWATLNGFDIPDRIAGDAEALLRTFSWDRSAGRNPPERWFVALRDLPNNNAVRSEICDMVEHVRKLHKIP